ncbi:unnamed protein product [Leuciscus chuanchicus]
MSVFVDGRKIDSISMKTCGDSNVCVNGSMNSGQSKVTLNSQCCNTDFCNSQNAPDLPQQSLNGKRCFTCNGTDCSKPLACEGDETQCFITTVGISGKNVTMKGCSSKFFCGLNATQSLGLPVQGYGFGVNMRCCEGNLCNAAHSLRVYFVMLIGQSSTSSVDLSCCEGPLCNSAQTFTPGRCFQLGLLMHAIRQMSL